MKLLSTIWDYVLLTLWGWPGILLVILASGHLLERAFMPKLAFSARRKLVVAAFILAIGLYATWRGLWLPANSAELDQQLKERERQSEKEQALQRRIESLRRDVERSGR
jgi:type VI protein secretion system component VasK